MCNLKTVNQKDLLKEAEAAPDKRGLEAHREAISLLRDKGHTWRQIAEFLTERGINTDHTKVLRMFRNPRKKNKKIQ